ncbi:DEAD/DEAH box helicase family protein [Bacillus cereus]|nr:DEAD/DEAH box helicase family protein [Bacillus cereus]EMA7399728.1 DEAD/DEAH box helicase family protein [Bacillus cereus]EMA7401305.1 DEAD/DEAH box helicase family protein [Bacillus cereus]
MVLKKSVECFIEQQLLEVGWDVKLKELVEKNVSVIPRDKDIKLNYLLFDRDEKPIACIIVNEGTKLSLDYKKKLLSCAKKINISYIFLVFGNEIYFWDFLNDDARSISSFYSQNDLERLVLISERENDGSLLAFKVPEEPHPIRIIHKNILDELNDGIIKGKKDFNLHLATGSGRTILTMDIINNLIKNGNAMKILIVTSRIEEARQIQYSLMNHLIDPSVVSSWIGKEDFEENFNKINGEIGVFISTIPTIMNRDFQISSGMFDTVIVYSNIQLRGISSLRERFGLDALYINFTSTPFNNEINGEKLDFSFDIRQAIESNILAPFEIVKVNVESKNLNTDEKKVLYKVDKMIYIQNNLINNVKHSHNTKTIIIASNIEEAQWIVHYLNDTNKNNNMEYASLVTSNLKSENINKNINRFIKDIYPQILVSVNLIGIGLKFNNVANLVLLNKINNPLFLYNVIGNVLLKNNKDKKVVKIYDFYENEKLLDLFSVNMMGNQISKSFVSKMIPINVNNLNDQSSDIEIVEKDKTRQVSKLEFIQMWELFVKRHLENDEVFIGSKNGIEDKVIEIIQDRKLDYFNEYNLCKAYGVHDLMLSDFIWFAINYGGKNRNNQWNRIFDVWIKSKKFTEMQYVYVVLLKNIGVNKGGITLKHLMSNDIRLALNLVGLGRELFGYKELEQIIKELNENVFKSFYELYNYDSNILKANLKNIRRSQRDEL